MGLFVHWPWCSLSTWPCATVPTIAGGPDIRRGQREHDRGPGRGRRLAVAAEVRRRLLDGDRLADVGGLQDVGRAGGARDRRAARVVAVLPLDRRRRWPDSCAVAAVLGERLALLGRAGDRRRRGAGPAAGSRRRRCRRHRPWRTRRRGTADACSAAASATGSTTAPDSERRDRTGPSCRGCRPRRSGELDGQETAVSGAGRRSTGRGRRCPFCVDATVVGSNVVARPPSSTAVHCVALAQDSAVGCWPLLDRGRGAGVDCRRVEVISCPPRSTATQRVVAAGRRPRPAACRRCRRSGFGLTLLIAIGRRQLRVERHLLPAASTAVHWWTSGQETDSSEWPFSSGFECLTGRVQRPFCGLKVKSKAPCRPRCIAWRSGRRRRQPLLGGVDDRRPGVAVAVLAGHRRGRRVERDLPLPTSSAVHWVAVGHETQPAPSARPSAARRTVAPVDGSKVTSLPWLSTAVHCAGGDRAGDAVQAVDAVHRVRMS